MLAIFLNGCSSTATYLAPQQSVYYKQSSPIPLTDPDLKSLFELSCMKNLPQGPFTYGSAKEQPQCLYIAVDASNATSAKTVDRSVRDKAIAYLLNISESNCANFLDRAFANRASFDMAKNLTQDITTGVGAITAFNNPGVTAALAMTNLVVGKSVDNVTATYFFAQAFQAFESAVLTERARIKSDIISKQAQRPPVSTQKVVQYTLFDALSDIRTYDAACSMRVGLAKLIETQGEEKKAQFKRSSDADNKATAGALANSKRAP